MAIPRHAPYTWCTWLTPVLSGDAQCLYPAWLQTQAQIEKVERGGFDLATWKIEHQQMVEAGFGGPVWHVSVSGVFGQSWGLLEEIARDVLRGGMRSSTCEARTRPACGLTGCGRSCRRPSRRGRGGSFPEGRGAMTNFWQRLTHAWAYHRARRAAIYRPDIWRLLLRRREDA